MMSKKSTESRNQITFIALEDLVPQDHLVRKIEKTLNFDFIYDLVEDLYSTTGKPSIDPVVLIKIAIIQYMFGIKSMRQTIKELETNIAYRWFIGYGFEEKIPHFSTFGKNYSRRFEGTKLFDTIFNKVLMQAYELGFVQPEEIFIDGTHVKASANKNKREKIIVKECTRSYKAKLEAEINEERKLHGQKPLKKKEQKTEVKQISKSPVDPESGLFWKTEREKMFCYSFNTACDKNGFILDNHVSSGNVHDSKNFEHIFNKVTSKFKSIKAVAVDAGYVTPFIAKTITDNGTIPVFPYKRPMTKKGFFKKYEYVYDEYLDIYICPNVKDLKYSTTDRNGYRQYKSNPKDCVSCSFKDRCTMSKNNQKVLMRHIWIDYLEDANHLRYTQYNKKVYKKRAETIERVFADAKEKHGMRYTQLRGLKKVEAEATLIFTCMNLKKMANWLWKQAA